MITLVEGGLSVGGVQHCYPSFLNDVAAMGPGWGYQIRTSEDCSWRVDDGRRSLAGRTTEGY